MLFKLELDYNAQQQIKEMSEEEYAQLQKVVIALPEVRPNYFDLDNAVVDSEALTALVLFGLKPRIKGIRGTYSPQKTGTWSENLNSALNAVHVHVPNIGLMLIKTVTVLEDCCTNELQNYLNQGWCIIAVCPPNGVRRPDYVLGHHDKDAT